MIVARNPGSANKATSYAERLRLGIAVIHGEQKESDSDMVDGRYSPPPAPSMARTRTMDVGVGVPVHPAKEKPPINVVGDVGGRIAIMVVRIFNLLYLLTYVFRFPCYGFINLQTTFSTNQF